jgi:hypothetical protein
LYVSADSCPFGFVYAVPAAKNGLTLPCHADSSLSPHLKVISCEKPFSIPVDPQGWEYPTQASSVTKDYADYRV